MYKRMHYEETMATTTRRGFLKMMVVAGSGLTLAAQLPIAHAGSATQQNAEQRAFEPNAFVRIEEDGKIRVLIKHLEMGQGSYTGLATLIAEELDADWHDVVAEGAPADAAKYKNLLWGAQGTGGSSSIANAFA